MNLTPSQIFLILAPRSIHASLMTYFTSFQCHVSLRIPSNYSLRILNIIRHINCSCISNVDTTIIINSKIIHPIKKYAQFPRKCARIIKRFKIHNISMSIPYSTLDCCVYVLLFLFFFFHFC
jgi:hypothetical protein